jgi:hypothetical protein
VSRSARFRCALPFLPALAALLLGCTKPIQTLIPNLPPSVRFTLAPISADPDNPVFYAYACSGPVTTRTGASTTSSTRSIPAPRTRCG